jgi:voltage-gated potassium channel
MTPPKATDRSLIQSEREALLQHVRHGFDGLMVMLSAAWIVLLVAELVGGGLPRSLEVGLWAIWAMFILDFVVELWIAPEKLRYLQSNWLTVVSLVLPAMRVFRAVAALRALRAARVVRSVGLLRILTSVNRGLSSLGATAAQRGVGYVLAATGLVIAVGAAGMAYFESPAAVAGEARLDRVSGEPLHDYGEALWWTAYAMTTGAPSHPVTPEGRLLGWLLSLYGLGVFGYLTATLASHFVRPGVPASGQPTAPR